MLYYALPSDTDWFMVDRWKEKQNFVKIMYHGAENIFYLDAPRKIQVQKAYSI